MTQKQSQRRPPAGIALPTPRIEGATAVEAALRARRSIRDFGDAALSLEAVATVLWAAQGTRSSSGERTAPSAGALYPLEVYLLARSVNGIATGIYKYRSGDHALQRHADGDPGRRLADAALGQDALARCPAVLIIAAVYARTASKYGTRAARYVHIEVGHAAQNVYLEAESLGLGTVIVGAFEDDRVRDALQLPEDEAPLALMPLGVPRSHDRRPPPK